MTREEAEQKILEKALEIIEICEAYNPGQEFFNLGTHDNCISFFNEHWDKDSNAPLNFWKDMRGEDSDE